ncbi:Phosphatidylinositol 4-phosphate 3-kinase C2 domain-containing subunit alpha [Manis javanica]|nr:Phosphatidylinositol 4-phosphate 3-kinase C2 domain-containing subunit alpha [Manis javanica]
MTVTELVHVREAWTWSQQLAWLKSIYPTSNYVLNTQEIYAATPMSHWKGKRRTKISDTRREGSASPNLAWRKECGDGNSSQDNIVTLLSPFAKC